MRKFNTTAVNLRATLDDLDPLVDASKPVARKLRPFTRQLRGFAADAVPTVRRPRRGRAPARRRQRPDRADPPAAALARIAVGPVNRNGPSRRGALPESRDALVDAACRLIASCGPT